MCTISKTHFRKNVARYLSSTFHSFAVDLCEFLLILSGGEVRFQVKLLDLRRRPVQITSRKHKEFEFHLELWSSKSKTPHFLETTDGIINGTLSYRKSTLIRFPCTLNFRPAMLILARMSSRDSVIHASSLQKVQIGFAST